MLLAASSLAEGNLYFSKDGAGLYEGLYEVPLLGLKRQDDREAIPHVQIRG